MPKISGVTTAPTGIDDLDDVPLGSMVLLASTSDFGQSCPRS